MSNQTSQTLFNATDSIAASSGTYSRIASVNHRGQVAIFINNGSAQNVTFTVQAGASPAGQPAGRNSLTTATADELYPLLKDDASGLVTFTVNAGTKRAIDLSSFAPEFVGLQAVSASGTVTDVTAFIYAHA